MGDFFGAIFPDAADVEALEIVPDPAQVSYIPSITRSEIPDDIKSGKAIMNLISSASGLFYRIA